MAFIFCSASYMSTFISNMVGISNKVPVLLNFISDTLIRLLVCYFTSRFPFLNSFILSLSKVAAIIFIVFLRSIACVTCLISPGFRHHTKIGFFKYLNSMNIMAIVLSSINVAGGKYLSKKRLKIN